MTTSKINLAQLRRDARLTKDAGYGPMEIPATLMLALIDTAEAATELDEPIQWLAEHYPKAMREMPPNLFRRFKAASTALDRFTTTEPT